MTRGRSARCPTARSAAPALIRGLVAAGLLGLLGCGPAAPSSSPTTAARTPATAAVAQAPGSAAQLGQLVVTSVPSGLPRMPDAELQPPAGEKDLDDVAAYSSDARHERQVLAGYGFRFGSGAVLGDGRTAQTSVFLDQFTRSSGAAAYTADLAGNDAAHYSAEMHSRPPGLPDGCRLLTAEHADPAVGLDGPTAIAWCAHGVFGVAVPRWPRPPTTPSTRCPASSPPSWRGSGP